MGSTRIRSFMSIVAIAALTVSGASAVSPVAAAPKAKCPKTTEAQNVKTTRAWARAINNQDWETLKRITHDNHNRSKLVAQIPEAPGNDDEVAVWQRMHRVVSGLRILIDATATSSAAEANATEHLPGTIDDVVTFLGDITGTLANGTPIKVPYSTWFFFKCGQIHTEYSVTENPPELVKAFLQTP